MTTMINDVAAKAAETEVGKRMLAANFHIAHTGGDRLAWERRIDDRAHLLVSNEDNLLGDKLDEFWFVGLHLTSGEDWIEDYVQPLDCAIEWCRDAQESFELCRKWVARIGGGFHPDTRGAQYVSDEKTGWQPLSMAEIAEYEADIEKLFRAPGDPYEYAVMALREVQS